MAKLDHFWMIFTTSTAGNADSDAPSEVDVSVANTTVTYQLGLPNERVRGRTNQFRINVKPGDLPSANITSYGPQHFTLRTRGGADAWLPSSIWIIGQAEDGELHLLAGVPHWPSSLWFSGDASEGKNEYTLNEGLQ